ncbi:MAG: biotin/lipoyl-binding protein [Clostridiales bacterium]|nr:biotin/lipoyl-binding protein [Clostridiales bacterium]
MGKINFGSKNKMIIILLVIVVIGGIGVWAFLKSSADVEIDTVAKADIYRSIEDTGIVRSKRIQDLQAAGNGEVLSISVEVGDKVKAGDVLVAIDDSAFKYQLESLEYQIKSLESNIAYLADPYSDLSLENYKSSVKIAKENFLKAKSDYENAKELFAIGAISKSEIDSLELLSTVGEMSYIMALNESSAASKGGDDDVIQQYNYQLKSLIPQLEFLENQIKKSLIKSPFDGIVSEIYVKEGEYVLPMSHVAQIYENQYYVESSLLEESFVQMEMDAPVEVSFDNVSAEGFVSKIYPTIKTVISDLGVSQQKGVVDITVNHEFTLIGREVDLVFMIGRRQGVLTIDKDALIKHENDDYVLVANDNKAELRKVSVGAKGNERFEILEGLKENEKVIIDPGDEIKDGDKISY